jgi:hypothetical protein
MVILGNYQDFFQGAHSGIPQWCFYEQAKNWLGKVQTYHGE